MVDGYLKRPASDHRIYGIPCPRTVNSQVKVEVVIIGRGAKFIEKYSVSLDRIFTGATTFSRWQQWGM